MSMLETSRSQSTPPAEDVEILFSRLERAITRQRRSADRVGRRSVAVSS